MTPFAALVRRQSPMVFGERKGARLQACSGLGNLPLTFKPPCPFYQTSLGMWDGVFARSLLNIFGGAVLTSQR